MVSGRAGRVPRARAGDRPASLRTDRSPDVTYRRTRCQPRVPSGPAGAGRVTGLPGTGTPGTSLTDSVEYAYVKSANAIRSLFTSRACGELLANVSQARW